MERQTKRLVEEAFNVELHLRYNHVIESVARGGFVYLNGASAVISIVFGGPDARPDIARIVGEIVSSDAYREL